MKIFKRVTQSIITLTSVLTLAACGSGSEGLQVEADLSGTSISLSKDQCIPFTVTRPEATESALRVMAGRVSGNGSFGIYADGECENLALANLQMQANTKTAKFYFKTNTAGPVTLEVATLNGNNIDMQGSVSFEIAN